MVEQERDKGWPMRGNSILLERVGGWDSQRRNILRIRVASGHEFSIDSCIIILFHDSTSAYLDVMWMKKQKETGLGGLGRPGARGKMRDPCCWSPCHDVTFPANLPEGSRPNLVWTANPRASRFPSIKPVGIDIEVEVRTVLHTPYSNQIVNLLFPPFLNIANSLVCCMRWLAIDGLVHFNPSAPATVHVPALGLVVAQVSESHLSSNTALHIRDMLPLPGSPSSSWAMYKSRLKAALDGADPRVCTAFWLFGTLHCSRLRQYTDTLKA